MMGGLPEGECRIQETVLRAVCATRQLRTARSPTDTDTFGEKEVRMAGLCCCCDDDKSGRMM
jgi:hypothetical protein